MPRGQRSFNAPDGSCGASEIGLRAVRGPTLLDEAMAYALNVTFSCPVELTIDVLGGKWKTVLLAHLKQGPRRYSELRALVPRLSDKMLTARLRDLMELSLVERSAGPSYALTNRGKSLGALLQAMYDWGERLAPEVGARFAPLPVHSRAPGPLGRSQTRLRTRDDPRATVAAK